MPRKGPRRPKFRALLPSPSALISYACLGGGLVLFADLFPMSDGAVGGLSAAVSSSPAAVAAASGTKLALQKYACAASAASIAEALTMPLDVTRIRMQLAGQGRAGDRPSSSSFRPPGMLSTAGRILHEEGFTRLYVGLTPAVLRQAIVGGVGVGLYPQIKDLFVHVQNREPHTSMYAAALRYATSPHDDAQGELAFGTKVLAGATSGVIGQLLAAPTCVVKVRLQADARLSSPRYRGTWHAFQTIPATEGWRALFRGIVPSLQRAAFMYGATISTYDEVKHWLVRTLYAGDVLAMDKISTHLMASSVSGLVASLVSSPFDTIKTRIIAQPVLPRKPIFGASFTPATAGAAAAEAVATAGVTAASAATAVGPGSSVTYLSSAATPSHAHGHHAAPLYSSTIDCVLKTVRREGPLALYKGFIPNYARLAPWQLTFFVVFEQLSLAITGQSLR